LHLTHKVVPSEILDPGVGVDERRDRGTCRQRGTGQAGRLVATTEGLIGALVVIVVLERRSDLAHQRDGRADTPIHSSFR